MERIDAPALATAARERRLTDGCSTASGVAEVRGLGLLLAAELDGIDAKVAADLPSTPGSSSTRSRRPRCASRRR